MKNNKNIKQKQKNQRGADYKIQVIHVTDCHSHAKTYLS